MHAKLIGLFLLITLAYQPILYPLINTEIKGQQSIEDQVIDFYSELAGVKASVSLNISQIDPNRKFDGGKTLLHHASSQSKYKDICEGLIRMGSWTYWKDDRSNTPLHIAAAAGCDDICDILLNAQRVLVCCSYGLGTSLSNLGRFSSLSTRNSDGFTPLHVAAFANHLEVCRKLINWGANVNSTSRSNGCFFNCFSRGSGQTALSIACNNQNLDLVELLLSKGAVVDEEVWLATLKSENFSICKALLTASMNTSHVNLRGQNRRTILHLAVNARDVAFCKTLLEDLKADPLSQDILGDTPLHNAINVDDFTICKLLCKAILKRKADVNQNNAAGLTPWLQAVQRGNLSVCKILLEIKANKDCVLADGSSALHIATKCCIAAPDRSPEKEKYLKLIGWLLNKGVNHELRDRGNKTIQNIADEVNDPVLEDFLKSYSCPGCFSLTCNKTPCCAKNICDDCWKNQMEVCLGCQSSKERRITLKRQNNVPRKIIQADQGLH